MVVGVLGVVGGRVVDDSRGWDFHVTVRREVDSPAGAATLTINADRLGQRRQGNQTEHLVQREDWRKQKSK
jgi:hypothetical protein